jgi:hypothetical protein
MLQLKSPSWDLTQENTNIHKSAHEKGIERWPTHATSQIRIQSTPEIWQGVCSSAFQVFLILYL